MREEREILQICRGLLCAGDQRDPIRVYEFVEREKAWYRVRRMCRALGVS